MKLFLCGGGSGKQVEDAYCEFLANIDKRKPILYVPLAMDDSKYDDCYEWFSEEVKYLGGIEYERSETLDDKLDQGTGCWNFDRRDSSAFCYGSGKRLGQ